ncbi:tetratricopeptide repeat protein [Cognatishimia sp. MH4019]|uniref:tetratricopeptide repeat protein n=1 Tax=Cognatishimia sp. MH4019 TaxID=2854030 RepID=UPI001CD1FED7|nr:tetratricopeptide repeat protein [Cognatishimia sp. MH4019]
MPTLPVKADGIAGAYLAGRAASFQSDYEHAAQYYAQALIADPSNPRLLENATSAFVNLGRVPQAHVVAQKMQMSGFESQIAHLVITAEQFKRGDYDQLLDDIAAGRRIGPLVDGLATAWAELGRGRMTEALARFDELSEQNGLQGFAFYHKALALASAGDYEGADALFSGEEQGPLRQTRRGAMAHIEVLSQLDRNGDALQLLDLLFSNDTDPGIGDVRARLEAGETLPFTHVTNAGDGAAEMFFSVAGVLSTDAAPGYTLLYSRLAEYLREDHVDAILLSAAMLEDLERYELATQSYNRVPRDHPAFHAAELGRADTLRRAGKDDAAIEVLQQLAKSHGDLPAVHTAMGDMMRGLQRFEEAIPAYDRALELTGEGDALWFVHYARGISHERSGDWDNAEADFRRALELRPNQPLVLNYLGYSLVEKKIKLDEALEMIETAAAERPDSGFIIDSLGWVLYRLGRYDEAVGHMERAAELMPVDPVVNDHLGDVYWAVGRETEAQFQWKRALSFIDPEDTDGEADPDRIRRKLEVGLDVVLDEEGAPPLRVANDG